MWFSLRDAISQGVDGNGARRRHSSSCSNKSGARVRIGFDRPIKFSRTISAEHDLKNVPNHGWRGAREGSWIAYTHRIPIQTLDVHAIDRYLWVGELLGFDDNPPDLTIHLSPKTIRNVQRLLEDHGVPGS